MRNNHKIKIYLAGDISRSRWRLQVMEDCMDFSENIEWLSPIDNISYSYQSLLPAHDKNKVFHITDKKKVDMCDIVFAYFRAESFGADDGTLYSGTSWECGYAHGRGKHVVAVNDMKPKLQCRYELVNRFVDALYKTLDEGIDHLREYVFEMSFCPKEG